jgi:hypothetical protein
MSLPATLTITTSIGAMVCSKVNQDNFGTTYRGSQSDATYNVTGVIKIANKNEGPSSSPRERHSVDAVLTYLPTNGDPSFFVQSYAHFIHPTGMPVADASDTCKPLLTFVTEAHADQLALFAWET